MEKNKTEHLFDKYYGPSGYRDNTPEEEIYVTDREDEAYLPIQFCLWPFAKVEDRYNVDGIALECIHI